MANKLTQKQEQFCRNVASGMTFKDAYINTYNTKMNDTAIRVESSRLALREDIQERIKELTKPLQEASQIQGLNQREEQIQFIKNRIAICEQKEDEQSLIRWNEQLNKIYGLYKEEPQTDANANKLESIDTSKLKQLLG